MSEISGCTARHVAAPPTHSSIRTLPSARVYDCSTRAQSPTFCKSVSSTLSALVRSTGNLRCLRILIIFKRTANIPVTRAGEKLCPAGRKYHRHYQLPVSVVCGGTGSSFFWARIPIQHVDHDLNQAIDYDEVIIIMKIGLKKISTGILWKHFTFLVETMFYLNS
jgi:hypothetical protein